MSSRAKQKGSRKVGWLSKRGGRIHTWHKRWFVLTGDLLFYYKTPQDTRPTGTIPLAGNKVIRHPDDPRQPTSFKFEIMAGSDRQGITSTHETYLISADTAEEADLWVTAIRRVMHEPYGGGMFGRSLDETMQVEARLGGNYVPVLLHRCIKFVRDYGINEIGIFRLPGQASRIHTLKEIYDQGSQHDFPPNEDVHTIASLLKLYLRELPEPVVPFVFYDSFRNASKLYETNQLEALDEFKRLLMQLPKVNFNVLKYLSRFLNEVQVHSDTNKMPSLNLATVFGPNLLRPQTNDPQTLMECNNVCTDFVCILIDRHEDFFPITADERPPKRLSVVVPPDDIVWHESKIATRSVYNPKSPKHEPYRPRQNSAPISTLSPRMRKSSKVASMVEQFNNMRATNSASQLLTGVSKSEFCSSGTGTHRPVISMPILTHHNGQPQNGLSDGEEFEDEDVLPSMIHRLSGLERTQSDTLSSQVIVNTISKEMETLERRLDIAREEAARYKKAARLWKTRFEQEKRARLAAEEQIRDLQGLIDETFKQFALDDSEDDFEDDSEGSVYNSDIGSPHMPLVKTRSILPSVESEV